MSSRLAGPPTPVLYDTTLRDGMQGFGLQLSVEQKVQLARQLDRLGVAYVEAGWPGANPRDTQVFQRLARAPLSRSRLVAFGSTRRPGVSASEDRSLAATISAATPAVALVGKASRWQVEHVLRCSAEENLAMIAESVELAVRQGREGVFDAEHFFDGYRADSRYSLEALAAAAGAGAGWLTLCDTNGGCLPGPIAESVAEVVARFGPVVGIHCHNDSGLAVAASLAAVEAGAAMVQGTVNGCGERCGNADLPVVAANLQLKLGRRVLAPARLRELTQLSLQFDSLANRPSDPQRPYLGAAAFLHKGGLHASGMARHRAAYQHVDPAAVGNRTRTVVSDQSGAQNVAAKLAELELPPLDPGRRQRLVSRLKGMEEAGWAFEDADASFELLVRRELGADPAPFAVLDSLVVASGGGPARERGVQASVKVEVRGVVVHTAAEGPGPVAALDSALRRALVPRFPELAQVELVDYRVRVIDGDRGTGATVRVGVDSSDGRRRWTTVGCSANILEASCEALIDSYEWAVRHPRVRAPQSSTA